MDWTPESSRRARGSRSMPRSRRSDAAASPTSSTAAAGWRAGLPIGCARSRRFEILNEVVLNQVLVRVVPPGGDADAATRKTLRLVQEERVCWLGGSRWHGMDAMRISVSNWSTTEEDRRRRRRLLRSLSACGAFRDRVPAVGRATWIWISRFAPAFSIAAGDERGCLRRCSSLSSLRMELTLSGAERAEWQAQPFYFEDLLPPARAVRCSSPACG
jgi:hypothetical protein